MAYVAVPSPPSLRNVTADRPMPRFEKPPVTEVVLGVQFDPLHALTPVHLGLWWQAPARRAKYPMCEERPALDPAIEEFGTAGKATFQLELSQRPPSPAIWFLTEGRKELLQVQRDRFIRNWTRQSSDASYPSYDALRPRFEEDFNDFLGFTTAEQLGEIVVRQCEVTYINPITAENSQWSSHSDVQRLLAAWTGRHSDGFLPALEDLALGCRFVIPDSSGQPAGRLFISLQPAFDPARQPLYVLTVTARGRPESPRPAGAMAFMDIAHEWVVRGFTSFTDEPMHQMWERTQ